MSIPSWYSSCAWFAKSLKLFVPFSSIELLLIQNIFELQQWQHIESLKSGLPVLVLLNCTMVSTMWLVPLIWMESVSTCTKGAEYGAILGWAEGPGNLI
jgi:hypothetical protein